MSSKTSEREEMNKERRRNKHTFEARVGGGLTKVGIGAVNSNGPIRVLDGHMRMAFTINDSNNAESPGAGLKGGHEIEWMGSPQRGEGWIGMGSRIVMGGGTE